MYGKPGNSGENSNRTVHPGGNFPEKKRRIPVPFDGNFSPKFPYKWLALKVPSELFEQFGCLETACLRLSLASLGIFFSLRYC